MFFMHEGQIHYQIIPHVKDLSIIVEDWRYNVYCQSIFVCKNDKRSSYADLHAEIST